MKMNIKVSALASCLIASLSFSAVSSDKDVYVSDNEFDRISVEWVEPKSFRDVKDSNFSSERFRKKVFNQLEKHLNKLASDLPEGQSISFKVTDLDLAGTIEPASFLGFSRSLDDVRIMRNVDIPRIKFEYELLDDKGAVIKAEEVNLKNMNYLNDVGLASRNKPYRYEKRMLSRWFAKNIIDRQA
jgi:hypothetical protein